MNAVMRSQWFEFDTILGKIEPIQANGRLNSASRERRTMTIESGPGEVVGWIIGVLAALGLAFRKYVTMWIRGGSEIAREKATAALMENFRTEIERLAKLNNELAAKLDEMQQENMMLRDEIRELRETIGTLQHSQFPTARM